ncbi:DUF1835 domain-containing protein [Paenibacillus sp. PL91]|uniref:DUF1835 domain-containing protein n=1 Tax=Paenibacillus sp. PL91 TaxID=2729538 RepID=UPI00145E9BBC|nr:DUF1835 domain-containing protein [Paenibacillus sp. PL91]MBC9201384.1 DUF1835 domain-containing protein [Paenibacillus sp. PL91]
MKISELRHAINGLSEREIQSLIMQIMLKADSVENDAYPIENLYKDLLEIYQFVITPNKQQQWEPDEDCNQVHIAFGDSFAGSLKAAIKKLGREDTDKVITFRDRYSIGPIWQLHEEEGRTKRQEWFFDHINGRDDEDDNEEMHQSLIRQISLIPPQATITIWSSMNAHEQVGLRYAVYLLRKSLNQVFILSATEACSRLFNRPNLTIEYTHAGEITPDKLQAVLRDRSESMPISGDSRAALETEWLKLAEQPEVLRICKDERVLPVSQDYFDSYLMETVEKLHSGRGNRDFIKAARVIGEALGYCDQYVGDDYFEYRIRELIYSGRLKIKGVPRAMRYYSVRSSVD